MNARFEQPRFGHRANTRPLATGQRFDETPLFTVAHHPHTCGFCHIRRHLGDRTRRGDSSAGGQPQLVVNRLTYLSDNALDRCIRIGVLRGAIHSFTLREIEKILVDTRPTHDRRVPLEDLLHLARIAATFTVTPADVDGIRRQAVRLGNAHTRTHAEGTHFITGRRDHAAGTGQSSHDDGLADLVWVGTDARRRQRTCPGRGSRCGRLGWGLPRAGQSGHREKGCDSAHCGGPVQPWQEQIERPFRGESTRERAGRNAGRCHHPAGQRDHSRPGRRSHADARARRAH